MKISSDIKENYFMLLDEARGVAAKKDKILRTKKVNKFSYLEEAIILMMVLLLFSMLFRCINLLCSYFLLFLTFIYFIISVIQILYIYYYQKRRDFRNTISIDEEGITDESYHGVKMTFNWKKVKAIVIKEHTIVILLDNPCYFYFSKSVEKKLIRAIQKYYKNILIIQ